MHLKLRLDALKALVSRNDEKNKNFVTSITRVRAIEAVSALQSESVKQNKHKMSLDEINEEIKATRKSRKIEAN